MQEEMSALHKMDKRRILKIRKVPSFPGTKSQYLSQSETGWTTWWEQQLNFRLKEISTKMVGLSTQELDTMVMLKEEWWLQFVQEKTWCLCIINGFSSQSQSERTSQWTSHQGTCMWWVKKLWERIGKRRTSWLWDTQAGRQSI